MCNKQTVTDKIVWSLIIRACLLSGFTTQQDSNDNSVTRLQHHTASLLSLYALKSLCLDPNCSLQCLFTCIACPRLDSSSVSLLPMCCCILQLDLCIEMPTALHMYCREPYASSLAASDSNGRVLLCSTDVCTKAVCCLGCLHCPVWLPACHAASCNMAQHACLQTVWRCRLAA